MENFPRELDYYILLTKLLTPISATERMKVPETNSEKEGDRNIKCSKRRY